MLYTGLVPGSLGDTDDPTFVEGVCVNGFMSTDCPFPSTGRWSGVEWSGVEWSWQCYLFNVTCSPTAYLIIPHPSYIIEPTWSILLIQPHLSNPPPLVPLLTRWQADPHYLKIPYFLSLPKHPILLSQHPILLSPPSTATRTITAKWAILLVVSVITTISGVTALL